MRFPSCNITDAPDTDEVHFLSAWLQMLNLPCIRAYLKSPNKLSPPHMKSPEIKCHMLGSARRFLRIDSVPYRTQTNYYAVKFNKSQNPECWSLMSAVMALLLLNMSLIGKGQFIALHK